MNSYRDDGFKYYLLGIFTAFRVQPVLRRLCGRGLFEDRQPGLRQSSPTLNIPAEPRARTCQVTTSQSVALGADPQVSATIARCLGAGTSSAVFRQGALARPARGLFLLTIASRLDWNHSV